MISELFTVYFYIHVPSTAVLYVKLKLKLCFRNLIVMLYVMCSLLQTRWYIFIKCGLHYAHTAPHMDMNMYMYVEVCSMSCECTRVCTTGTVLFRSNFSPTIAHIHLCIFFTTTCRFCSFRWCYHNSIDFCKLW